MPDLIAALPTWKSPRSESPRLSAEVVSRERVTPPIARTCISCSRPTFRTRRFSSSRTTWREKDTVILLRDPDDARVVGFSTLMKIGITIENRNVVGFFSGDTIIAREHWGSSLLARLWVTTVFREAECIRQHAPDTLFYWFLISSGYKTWRYLPTFFVAYAPHPDVQPSPFDRQVMQTLATTEIRRRLPRRFGHRPVPPRQSAAPRCGRGDRSETARPARGILHPDESRSLARR